MDTIIMAAKDVIKNARYKLMMTQTDFAKKLNVTYSMVSMYESGKRKPGIKVIKKIIDVLKKEGIKVKFEDLIE